MKFNTTIFQSGNNTGIEVPADVVEGLGAGLMRLEEAMEELKERYDLTTEDLNIDLGPLGTLLSDKF